MASKQDSYAKKLAHFFHPLSKGQAWLIIAVFALISGSALWYAAHHLGINSKSSDMFDEQLPFRQRQDRFEAQFPFADGSFAIALWGGTPEQRQQQAQVMAQLMRADTLHFKEIFMPGGEPFFLKNGLLFRDTTSLQKLQADMKQWQPFLSYLLQDYSLRGFYQIMNGMAQSPYALQGQQQMAGLMQELDSVHKAFLAGEPHTISWQQLMQKEPQQGTAVQFIQVTPQLPSGKLLPVKPAIIKARSLRDSLQNLVPGVQIRLTGKKAMAYEEMQSVIKGASRAGVLALLMVSAILWLSLRSFRLIAAALLTLIAGLALTAAFSALAVGNLNMISVAFAVLYIGLGIDYVIHVVLRYKDFYRQGMPLPRALYAALQDVAPALLLSTLSTAVAFYAFVPTSFQGISELGLIAGTGMFFSFVISLTLLPALLTVMGSSRHDLKRRNATPNPISQEKASRLPLYQSHGKSLRILAFLLGMGSLLALPHLRFSYDHIELRDPETESIQTLKTLLQNSDFSPWSAHVLCSDSSSVNALTRQLKAQKEVGRVISALSFIPRYQEEKLRRVDSIGRLWQQLPPLPQQWAEVSAQEQLQAMQKLAGTLNNPLQTTASYPFAKSLQAVLDSLESLPPEVQAKDLAQLQSQTLQTLAPALQNLEQATQASAVRLQNLPKGLKKRWISRQDTWRVQVFPAQPLQSNRDFERFTDAVAGVAPQAAGDVFTAIRSGEAVIDSFLKALIYSFVAISLLLLLYLRSVWNTLVVLLPLLLAGSMAAAVSVLAGIPLNFANIIAIPLLLGLGVDYGVHILHRAQKTQEDGSLWRSSTTKAIIYSALTTLASFGNLAFSPHRGTASMGLLLAVGLAAVLFTTLLLLPAFTGRIKKEVS